MDQTDVPRRTPSTSPRGPFRRAVAATIAIVVGITGLALAAPAFASPPATLHQPARQPARRPAHLQAHRRLLLLHRDRAGVRPDRAAPGHHAPGPGHRRRDGDLDASTPAAIMGAHIWAPEIHFIDGKWYVYFAAGATNDIWAIRMYVLESTGANPLTGDAGPRRGRSPPRGTRSPSTPPRSSRSGVRYLVWAQSEPGIATNTNLYIAKMANPWTITGTPTRITVPTLAWETARLQGQRGPGRHPAQRQGLPDLLGQRHRRQLLPGPAHRVRVGRTCSARRPGRRRRPRCSRATPRPASAGPGHNSFTVSEDGQSDILVYHDRNYQDISGDPLNDPNRRTRLQKLYWNADGTPNFGIPVAGRRHARSGCKSYNFPDRFVRHWEYRARIEANVTNLADSQFRIVTGPGRQRHGLAGVDQLPRLLPAPPQQRGVGGQERRLHAVPERRDLLPAGRPREQQRRSRSSRSTWQASTSSTSTTCWSSGRPPRRPPGRTRRSSRSDTAARRAGPTDPPASRAPGPRRPRPGRRCPNASFRSDRARSLPRR